MNIKIGVTGGIGSGKSMVVNHMAHLGGKVYHADQRAKELVNIPELKSQIIELLGEEAYKDETYNTKFVARVVFNDKIKLEALNRIIHPAVFRDLDNFCNENQGSTIVYESALILQTNHTHLFDYIILVNAPLENRIERVMLRDHCSREEVILRINNQSVQYTPSSKIDFIIENVDRDKTKERIEEIWHHIHQKKSFDT